MKLILKIVVFLLITSCASKKASCDAYGSTRTKSTVLKNSSK